MTRAGKVPAFIRFNERLIAWSYRRHGLHRMAVQVDAHTRIACWAPRRLRPLAKSGFFDDPSGKPPPTNEKDSKSKSILKPAALLLHGFGGSGIWQWVQQVPALSRHFDLYIPDLVFFGDSSSSSEERSDVFQAESMVKLMDRLGVAACHVIGLSYGGIVAYRMAALHPERVSRLVLVGSGVMATREDYDDMLKRWQVEHPSEVFLPCDPPAVQRLLSLAHYHPPKLPLWLLKALSHLLQENKEVKQQMLDSLLQQLDNPPDPFPTPPMESLLVWGDEDGVFPSSIAHRMHRHFGDRCKLVVVDKAGHALNAHRPKEFNRAVLAFLLPPP
ncbi:unnamed protein product [Closterium sp. Naga37s-1]|nr:unnamed protein product [Closterium sp. Naga37s-1]